MLPALLKNLACSTIVTLPGQKGLNASIEWLKLRSLEVLYTIYSSTGFSNLLDWSWPATALLYSLSYLFVQHSQTRSKQHQNSLKCVNSISKNKFSNLKLPKEISQKIYKSKQGRPPRKSEKGAVRCGWAYVASETTLLLGQIKLKIATAIILLLFWPLRIKIYNSNDFATFFDPSTPDLLQQRFCYFFGL